MKDYFDKLEQILENNECSIISPFEPFFSDEELPTNDNIQEWYGTIRLFLLFPQVCVMGNETVGYGINLEWNDEGITFPDFHGVIDDFETYVQVLKHWSLRVDVIENTVTSFVIKDLEDNGFKDLFTPKTQMVVKEMVEKLLSDIEYKLEYLKDNNENHYDEMISQLE